MVYRIKRMKITFRIWLLILFIIISGISIFVTPNGITFLQDGVVVKSVEQNSTIFNQGLRQGMVLNSINGQIIKTIEDYSESLEILSDGQEHRIEILTSEITLVGLFDSSLIKDVIVSEIPKTRIQTGLDLQGGARALVGGLDGKLTESQLEDLIAVSEERLNVYGLTDAKFFRVETAENRFMGVEIAGSTPSDLEELIEKQGKFEAKIQNKSVFIGGNKDITYVAKSGQDSLIYDRQQTSENEWTSFFRFSITLSPEAADKYAEITKDIPLSDENPGYLNEKIDFYIDDILTSSLLISENLKGSNTPQHSIQGSGSGATPSESDDSAKAEMKKLQAILSTGSLPFKLKIEKIDRISPNLGKNFTNQILTAGIFAILAVSLLIFLRYKKLKISLALVSISFSEVLIILGIASLINWNLDLPSIAGIVAAIGTGIDSQIIILDETKTKLESLKQKIKNAFSIILTAFLTTLAALIPLTGWIAFMGIGAASAGLLQGFALMTLIGLAVGVFISRPAFADIIKQIEK